MSRMSVEKRKEHILSVAVVLSRSIGYDKITGHAVAKASYLKSHASINYIFGTIAFLKACVMDWAVRNEDLEILLQGLVYKDTIALAANAKLRKRAILWAAE